ncbi:hypothetical protein [Salidesulfovibrio brasiliensis]|uniref:hypothetical protein n=1 Tax=Salidesulfovibrio brasiliensis TaxID=221711 RepID=UPI0006D14B0F|nr:hypothetical protein [Salidesulfovibrio brasiliensis]
MKLSSRDLGVLKDIQNYSRIERYHGMLPAKLADVYDEGVIARLVDLELIEEGAILTKCGSNPSGYRLTDDGKAALSDSGFCARDSRWAKLTASEHPDVDSLDEGTLDVLADLYHLSRLRRSGGLVRKEFLEDYDNSSLSALYDLGLVYWVKLKGKKVESGKGYMISDKAIRMLKLVGEID